MDSLFQKFMSETEAAGLSEGDYLKACNALKQAFEAAKLPTTVAQPVEDRIAQRRPLDITIANQNEENDCHFTFQIRVKEYCVTRGHQPNEVRISYTINSSVDGGIQKQVEDKYMGHTDLCNLIHKLILASQTQALTFHSEDLGEVYYDLEKTFQFDSEFEKKVSRVYENDDDDVVFDNSSFANIMRCILGSLLHQHYTSFA